MLVKKVVRLNVNVTESLLAKVDEFANYNNINRTAAVGLLLSYALRSELLDSYMDEEQEETVMRGVESAVEFDEYNACGD